MAPSLVRCLAATVEWLVRACDIRVRESSADACVNSRIPVRHRTCVHVCVWYAFGSEYRLNGFRSFVLLMGLFYGGSYAGWWKPTVLYDNFWPLFTVVNYFSLAQVVFLYIKGRFFSDKVTSLHHPRKPLSRIPDVIDQFVTTGNLFWDLWYGVELNPRLLGFDFKYFAYRPLIMGWAVLILSIVHHQYVSTTTLLPFEAAAHTAGGADTRSTTPYPFQWRCTSSSRGGTRSIICGWSIRSARRGTSSPRGSALGWWCVSSIAHVRVFTRAHPFRDRQWGDHAFYPFFYSIQAHYLIEPFELHPLAYVAILVVFFTGYTIFRQYVPSTRSSDHAWLTLAGGIHRQGQQSEG